MNSQVEYRYEVLRTLYYPLINREPQKQIKLSTQLCMQIHPSAQPRLVLRCA